LVDELVQLVWVECAVGEMEEVKRCRFSGGQAAYKRKPEGDAAGAIRRGLAGNQLIAGAAATA